MKGLPITQYHVFLASPGDVEPERAAVFEAVAAPALPPDVPFCGVEGPGFTASEETLSGPVAAAGRPCVCVVSRAFDPCSTL